MHEVRGRTFNPLRFFMSTDKLTCDAIADRQRYARVSVHRGIATVQIDGVSVPGFAEFLLPVEGSSVVAFRARSEELGGDFASDLRIEGVTELGASRIHCPECYTRPAAVAELTTENLVIE